MPSNNTRKIFLAYDEDMMLHCPIVQTEDPNEKGFVHERPSRLRATHNALMDLEARLLLSRQQYNQQRLVVPSMECETMYPRRFVPLVCHPASRETICRVHTSEHYNFMERTSHMSPKALKRLTRKSEDLYFCKDTFYAARLAVGGCIHAVNAVTAPFGISHRAICLVRPPAHHATKDAAMGFCYFNNIVIAAQHALDTGRASKVFILDWDVHHGNGIQELTYENPDIFYLSIHRASSEKQWFYPDTGRPNETGSGCGIGTNANIALEQGGMGNKEYAAVFCELVLPAMESFEPDLILIACGADAAKGDLLGDCGLTSDMYYILTKNLMETAGIDTPLIAILEGGYNLPVLADCLQAVAIALLDEPFDSTFVPSSQSSSPMLSREIAAPSLGTARQSDSDERWSLCRYWSPTEKADLQLVRSSHPEKGITKQAMLAVQRAARALAQSHHHHHHQGAHPHISIPLENTCSHGQNHHNATGFRRLRLLDFDRCPWAPPEKRQKQEKPFLLFPSAVIIN